LFFKHISQNTENNFEGKKLEFLSAPRPESINFRNLKKGGVPLFLRYSICILITAAIFIFSSVVLISFDYYKKSLQQDFPIVDCK
jgi:hypothetical protein